MSSLPPPAAHLNNKPRRGGRPPISSRRLPVGINFPRALDKLSSPRLFPVRLPNAIVSAKASIADVPDDVHLRHLGSIGARVAKGRVCSQLNFRPTSYRIIAKPSEPNYSTRID
ncbi:hypothetical protein EVAR_82292_1 [Eumeta japonica]|uniref:Uncharacterized protein n=1 Tax=Eumeta variegata TaxID=151549 RepID=A0A4C1VZ45_EUMVA|nr:hypothetical protein EVAR_82292_1 [Eumeta japonica]